MEKNRHKLLLLLVTSLSALLAVALVYFYVESRVTAERTRLAADQATAIPRETREVVVASRPIRPGQTIGREDARVVRINLDAIEPSVDLPPLERILGQVANQAIHPGEWLLAAKVGVNPGEGSPLGVALEPGQRAIRVKVDGDTGLLGLIAPADRVDVVTVFPAGQSGEIASRILLQNVPILAVGNHCQPAREVANKEEGGASRNTREEQKESSVTLALNSQEAGMLALAVNSGKIHLLLRNRADQQRAASPPIRLAALAGAGSPSGAQSPGESQQRVTVIQGSQITSEVVQ